MDSYILNNGSYDTNLLILRSLFAINPATNLPISTGYIIATDGAGGINWVDPLLFGGISLPNLTSTVAGLGSIRYVSTSYLNTALISTNRGLGTFKYVSTSYLDAALFSTVQGLGTLRYVSSSYLDTALISTIENLAVAGYISSQTLAKTTSTANAALTSTQYILDPSRYVSTGALQSTTAGLLVNPTYFVQASQLDTSLVSTVLGLGVFTYVSTAALRLSLTSTVKGLGNVGYISTSAFRSSITSTVQGLGSAGYISSGYLNAYVTNALANAGTTYNYVSTPSLISYVQTTTDQLGAVGYVSTTYLTNYVTAYVTAALANVGTSGNYVSTPTLNLSLTSTAKGLGTLNYISSSALQSTTAYILDDARYVSTGALVSTVTGIFGTFTAPVSVDYLNTALLSTVTDLGTRRDNNFVSTISLQSSIAGLGSGGDQAYVSSLSLQSTTKTLSDMIVNNTAVTVDRAGNLVIQGGIINVTNMAGSIIYLSTFLQSSVTYQGTNGTMSATVLPNPTSGTDLLFSTCIIPFSAMSNYINNKSRIYVDFFPTLAFTELNSGATGSLFLPISTFIQYGDTTGNMVNSNLLPYVNTSYVNANSKTTGFSNSFGQQIKLQIPGSVINGNWSSNYILYHYMPAALTYNLTSGLKSNSVTVQGSSTNSLFISVQNLP
jgi:hypothetical protein